ncbi:MAG: LON peptidase substrate-binding domain-containing protein, partial [Vallitaleaceae bacterium]|nr:LON peptidase substrate-binding domain-containing protein [Vallitaleaceae bacterium]
MGKIDTNMILPVIPLRGLTVFPNSVIHFDVKRPETIDAINSVMNVKDGGDKKVFLVTQKDSIETYPLGSLNLYNVGVIATIKQVMKLPSKEPETLIRVICQGKMRGQLNHADDVDRFLKGDVTVLEDEDDQLDTEMEALVREAHATTNELALVYPKLSKEVVRKLLQQFDPSKLADSIG